MRLKTKTKNAQKAYKCIFYETFSQTYGVQLIETNEQTPWIHY